MIKVGTHWLSNDFTKFVVEKVENGWIYYAKVDKLDNPTDAKYNCLQEAFTHRFSATV